MSNNSSTKKISPKTFSCPSCGASVTVRAAGQTLVVVCGSCQSSIDATNDQFRLIQKYIGRMNYETRIPIGQKGVLGGVQWQVLGLVKKVDASGYYQWDEYILFNPYYGYRFLVENAFHWNFVTMVRKHIGGHLSGYGKMISHNGQSYDLFDEGTAKVIFVVGEFYWRVSVDDVVNTQDFICPPRMLSVERNQTEEVWSEAIYVDSTAVSRAFKLSHFPPPMGVAPNQPSKWGEAYKKIKMSFFIFLALIVAIQFFHLLSAKNKIATSFAGTYTRGVGPGDGLVKTLEGFVVAPGEKNLELTLSTNIINNWFEVSGQLVDEDGDEIRDFEFGVEYYTGRDYDGSWSEGSPGNHLFLPSIPPGTYKILFSYAGLEDPQGSQEISAHIEIKKDVPLWQNFLLAMGLLGTVFGFISLLVHNFESKRWSNSGVFYGTDSGDDD